MAFNFLLFFCCMLTAALAQLVTVPELQDSLHPSLLRGLYKKDNDNGELRLFGAGLSDQALNQLITQQQAFLEQLRPNAAAGIVPIVIGGNGQTVTGTAAAGNNNNNNNVIAGLLPNIIGQAVLNGNRRRPVNNRRRRRRRPQPVRVIRL